ncbi:IS5 family transposase [Deinococcus sp. NW-56]|uniref:IS5 family transposase n=1 Tax=Deinococcus sp. NW-56 TaxID=2080419 RepID=UPI000CF3C21A|nr:IS5 family transposase [Deinococcus sp. NW-56]
MDRRAYPSDVDDEMWLFMRPYLTLVPENAPQRKYSLREMLNATLWVARTGSQWAYLPHDFPPYELVYQQARRWMEHGCFENMAHDLRALKREDALREGIPTVAIIDSRTLQSTAESGARAGYDGAKRRKGSKIHAAVDTLGNVLTLLVTPGNEQDRDQVYDLCREVQALTGGSIDVVIADQGYTGDQASTDAAVNDVELVVVKRPSGAHGFVLLPRRWIVERTFAWTARFRRLARDLERLPEMLLGFHWLALSVLLLHNLSPILGMGS